MAANSIPSCGVSVSCYKHDTHSFGFVTRKVASTRRAHFRVHAVKIPDGVVIPKVEPKLKPPVIGFTNTAEIWNSRACMIGLIGTFVVELIINKGILEVIGLEIGKGLDIPL